MISAVTAPIGVVGYRSDGFVIIGLSGGDTMELDVDGEAARNARHQLRLPGVVDHSPPRANSARRCETVEQ